MSINSHCKIGCSNPLVPALKKKPKGNQKGNLIGIIRLPMLLAKSLGVAEEEYGLSDLRAERIIDFNLHSRINRICNQNQEDIL